MSIAAIVPGQRYRLRIRAAEMPPCEGCGLVFGECIPGHSMSPKDDKRAHGCRAAIVPGIEVVALGPELGDMLCPRCEGPLGGEGFVIIDKKHRSGRFLCVPYTWLESEEEP